MSELLFAAGTAPAWISSSVVRNALANAAPDARTSATEQFHHGISQPQTFVPYFFIAYWCGLPAERARRPNQLERSGVASSFQRGFAPRSEGNSCVKRSQARGVAWPSA